MNSMNYYTKALRQYIDFKGRATRPEFWYFVLFSLIIEIILSIFDSILGLDFGNDEGLLSSIYSLAVFLPSIGVGIRRMHDINKKGWWMLIPFYNIYLWCQPGTVGDNRFGPDSKSTPTPKVTSDQLA
jgi:uncharacterized membrane protein YhaH (DUF805 family)